MQNILKELTDFSKEKKQKQFWNYIIIVSAPYLASAPHVLLKRALRDFPGSPVVKTPRFLDFPGGAVVKNPPAT